MKTGKRFITFALSVILLACFLFGSGCEKCDHSFTVENPSNRFLKMKATCYTCALYYRSCEKCGRSSKGIDPQAVFWDREGGLAHKYGEWTTVYEATDSSAGLKEAYCRECGQRVRETIPVPHNYSLEIVSGPQKRDYIAFDSVDLTGLDARLICSDCGHTVDLSPYDVTPSVNTLIAKDTSFTVSFNDGNKEYVSAETPVRVKKKELTIKGWDRRWYETECNNLDPHRIAEDEYTPHSPYEFKVTFTDTDGNPVSAEHGLAAGKYYMHGEIGETENYLGWEKTVKLTVKHSITTTVASFDAGDDWPKTAEIRQKCANCSYVEKIIILSGYTVTVSGNDLCLYIPYALYDLEEVRLFDYTDKEISGAFLEENDSQQTILKTSGNALKKLPNGLYKIKVVAHAKANEWRYLYNDCDYVFYGSFELNR